MVNTIPSVLRMYLLLRSTLMQIFKHFARIIVLLKIYSPIYARGSRIVEDAPVSSLMCSLLEGFESVKKKFDSRRVEHFTDSKEDTGLLYRRISCYD